MISSEQRQKQKRAEWALVEFHRGLQRELDARGVVATRSICAPAPSTARTIYVDVLEHRLDRTRRIGRAVATRVAKLGLTVFYTPELPRGAFVAVRATNGKVAARVVADFDIVRNRYRYLFHVFVGATL